MIPFCNKTGVGLIPWSPVARGMLARPYEEKAPSVRSGSDKMLRNIFQDAEGKGEGGVDREVVGRVEKIAKEKTVSMASIALAWVLSKDCAPIVLLNSVKRIDEAVGALKVTLTEDEIKYLEEAYFP
jgi:aryl-alcohol dehydrogenase-like predicted oxidoreductase